MIGGAGFSVARAPSSTLGAASVASDASGSSGMTSFAASAAALGSRTFVLVAAAFLARGAWGKSIGVSPPQGMPQMSASPSRSCRCPQAADAARRPRKADQEGDAGPKVRGASEHLAAESAC